MARLPAFSTNATESGSRPVLYANNCSAIHWKRTEGIKVWGRFLNPEGATLPITAGTGATVWVMGYKSERGGDERFNRYEAP